MAARPTAAQVQVKLDTSLPVIRFEGPPPLVVVQPGIQAVEDYDEEVFYVDGWYWHRRGATWFRSRNHTWDWHVVGVERVPAALVKLPPGQYRRFKRTQLHREHSEERLEERREHRKDKAQGLHGH